MHERRWEARSRAASRTGWVQGTVRPGGRFVSARLWFELPFRSEPGLWVGDVWVGLDHRQRHLSRRGSFSDCGTVV